MRSATSRGCGWSTAWTAPARLIVAGRLSSHVLDTYHGRPAAGVAIELFEVGKSARALLVQVATNRDGRTGTPLIADGPLRIGTYELVFHIGDYFRSCGVTRDARPFLDQVPVRFGISEPEGHYHVPLGRHALELFGLSRKLTAAAFGEA